MDVLLGTLFILSIFTLLTTLFSISSVSSISDGLLILHVCVTHAVILDHLLIHGHLRDFVEEKHEVDDEGDDQGKELDGEEVPGEEAGQLLGVLADVNLGSALGGGRSLLLLGLVCSLHCLVHLLGKLLLLGLLLCNLLQVLGDAERRCEGACWILSSHNGHRVNALRWRWSDHLFLYSLLLLHLLLAKATHQVEHRSEDLLVEPKSHHSDAVDDPKDPCDESQCLLQCRHVLRLCRHQGEVGRAEQHGSRLSLLQSQSDVLLEWLYDAGRLVLTRNCHFLLHLCNFSIVSTECS